MAKFLNFLTFIGVLFFAWWMFKRYLRQRKLKQHGYEIPSDRIRPITLLSIVVVVMYGGYMVYYFTSQS